jgi:hypothetical protein
MRTLQDQCAHHHRFETLQHTSRVIHDWTSSQHPATSPSIEHENIGGGLRFGGMT